MAEFKIYRFLVYETLWDMGDAIVAATDEKQAFSLLEQEIMNHFNRADLDLQDVKEVKLKIRGKIEETSYTTNQEGVIYARSSARDSF
jgi:hypothetical protein